MKNPLLDSLLPNIDSILGVRDSIGAVLHPIYILTRTWSGKKPGDGQPNDSKIQILPTPGIKEFAHDVRLQEGGAVKQGDIVLKGVSKSKYPLEDMIDCSTSTKSIEKFYVINNWLYTVIHVKENYLSWDVQVREYSNQTLYEE